MLRNIIYITTSILLFFIGLISYGVILNLREITLDEALMKNNIVKVEDPKLIVNRKTYRIELYSKNKLVKTFKAVFGKNNNSVKSSSTDNVTPIGEYQVCSVKEDSKYYKVFYLNYPSINDAAEALSRNYINHDEYDAILIAHNKSECTPKETKLGSAIGIHGIGKYNYIFKNLPFSFNWTNGSIAVSNESMDELEKVIKIGTSVSITSR